MDVEKFMSALDVAAEVMRPSHHVVQGAVENMWTFAVGHSPSEEHSDWVPPICLSDRSDVIAIDGVLGLYDPSTQEITIFSKGISWASKVLDVHPDDLAQIVKIHEWAHALLHLGAEESDHIAILRTESEWAKRIAGMNTWFSELDPSLHETLAQLLTREGIRWLRARATIPEAKAVIDRIDAVFRRLMQRAPTAYQIDKYANVSRDRIISSVRLLKSGGLVGADAWETVVSW